MAIGFKRSFDKQCRRLISNIINLASSLISKIVNPESSFDNQHCLLINNIANSVSSFNNNNQ